MITTNKLAVRFGAEPLFENVSVKFSKGNCYGLIGANGSGKSTLLKVLSGELEAASGEVHILKNQRIATLKQNHFEFDEFRVIDVVIMGHKELYSIMREKDELYNKPDFNDKDGIRVGDLEARFAELDGWQAESMAATLLSDLGIENSGQTLLMRELDGSEKVRVLLAQALFANPDILLLDEPTNHLDINTIAWLEEFLINFQNTLIVVSHDRNFLDNICTHIADIDFRNIQIYPGNYSFWSQASQLVIKQREEKNKKTEEKMEELRAFVARFSANASKAKQATSRKNILDKLTLEEIKPSTRQYPRIRFNYVKIPGKDVLHIKELNKSVDGNLLIKNFTLDIMQGEKIAFISRDPLVLTTLFQMLEGEIQPDSGEIAWGPTATHSYLPKDNTEYFKENINLLDWLAQYSPDNHINFLRGYLGRMLFSGDDVEKSATVLSGGEKVRCMLSKMMVTQDNVLILDEPTNHLDLEAITALNNALIDFPGTVLFTSQDYQFIQTVADRIVEITPNGRIDSTDKYEDYIKNPLIKKRREKLYP
ncbi:MAG: ATP-binding cassette domain-containing protein [Heliobacteriaceae bacterium]|jgi:ATPase subunit of ABC transporter with duplicated ATPase domains|nr:ATP-binding cassette domain-containing protein [Heliobacteriaceae bacterium]